MNRLSSYLFIYLAFATSCLAQEVPDTSIAMYMTLDAVTIRDENFDVKRFVEIIQKDESFYKAFRNIRELGYKADNNVKVLDKKGNAKATYRSKTTQLWDGQCRSMSTIDERITGDYFDSDREYNYYTAELYDKLFFTHGKICKGTSSNEKSYQSQQYGKRKGRVEQLKTLLFKPGQEVSGIPFIGNKTAIFTKKMAKYYDYDVKSGTYEGKTDCYIFTVSVKPEYQKKQTDETVIKYMETYFDKDNYQVLARNYHLLYDGTMFSFDVNMRVEITRKGKQYVPVFIEYDGTWDIPLQKPEIAKFTCYFDYE